MDLEELLEKLDMESPAELIYLEQFSDLMEDPCEVPFETLNALFEGMDQAVLSELVSGYFEDIMPCVPDGEDELYTLLYGVGATLQTLAEGSEEETLHMFAEELFRFRNWYLFDACVMCANHTEGTEREITLYEALTNQRVKNFTDNDYAFDFSGALSFQLDEYVVSLASLYHNDDENEDGDEGEYDDEYGDEYEGHGFHEHDDDE